MKPNTDIRDELLVHIRSALAIADELGLVDVAIRLDSARAQLAGMAGLFDSVGDATLISEREWVELNDRWARRRD